MVGVEPKLHPKKAQRYWMHNGTFPRYIKHWELIRLINVEAHTNEITQFVKKTQLPPSTSYGDESFDDDANKGEEP
jgi:hypothetical protein